MARCQCTLHPRSPAGALLPASLCKRTKQPALSSRPCMPTGLRSSKQQGSLMRMSKQPITNLSSVTLYSALASSLLLLRQSGRPECCGFGTMAELPLKRATGFKRSRTLSRTPLAPLNW
ncbi:hypothetical protein WJX72_001673 [[Myrmecia] bisecta]|uniref:Uncharacterized protein n=1 Tax=[Myrmecia] bisecta TaxID=41462 RepID=A0AAW1Q095_9CHLO